MLYRMQFDWVSDIHQIRAEGTINNEKFEMSRHKSSLINWNELFQKMMDSYWMFSILRYAMSAVPNLN